MTLADNIEDGFFWSRDYQTIVLDARLDEANMVVQLARALRLLFGRD